MNQDHNPQDRRVKFRVAFTGHADFEYIEHNDLAILSDAYLRELAHRLLGAVDFRPEARVYSGEQDVTCATLDDLTAIVVDMKMVGVVTADELNTLYTLLKRFRFDNSFAHPMTEEWLDKALGLVAMEGSLKEQQK